MEEEFVKKHFYGRKYICAKIIGDDEWKDILEYPETDRNKISNYLRTHFLQASVQSRVAAMILYLNTELHSARELKFA